MPILVNHLSLVNELEVSGSREEREWREQPSDISSTVSHSLVTEVVRQETTGRR